MGMHDNSENVGPGRTRQGRRRSREAETAAAKLKALIIR
ncbi:hypothetical protein XOCgx_1398 [Xanthomonas oryzae pv. oryzicola]|nr:hypothetical protein XOCgx_1398 [Xanthomonas oryzae pv. oryzicola]